MIFRYTNSFFYRFKFLLSAFFDFFIINLFFYIYLPNNKFFVIGTRRYFYIFFWLLISYIFDRYYQDKLIIKNSDLIYQITTSIKSIIIFGAVILLYNWFLGNYLSRTYLFTFLSVIFLLSTITQYYLNKIFSKALSANKYWTLLDNCNIREYFNDNCFLNQNKIKIKYIKNINQNIEKIKMSNGLIVKDFDKLSSDDLEILLKFKRKGKKIYKLSNWLRIFIKSYPPNIIDKRDFLELNFISINNSLQMRLKRAGDILVSIFIIFFSLPLFLLFGILIFIEDRGPIFYSQKRSGYLGEVFTVWKLRSMKVDSEKKGLRWSRKNDPRITKVGKFIRKTRIDELPQLWSVFNGDMSLIGPRPERPEFDKLLAEKIPFYTMRYLLRPGLSGWAQVNYPYTSSVEESTNKLSLDLYYVANYSIFLDLSIFLKTLRLIFNLKSSKIYSST